MGLWHKYAWVAYLAVFLSYLLFHWSLDYATISQVATMITTGPIFVGLINLWLNKQPFTAAKIISGASAMIGVALLVKDGYLAKLAGAILNQSLTAWQVLAIIVICTSVAVEATWARLRQPRHRMMSDHARN
ncbi:MAG: EamA family transporter [Desulfobacterales bacterium]|nr:MAG: EamA family transporter [Desulfobacterales bacterium]